MKKILCLFVSLISFFAVQAQEVRTMKIKKHESFSVDYSYDGHLMALGGENEFIVMDVSNDSIVHRVDTYGGIIIDVKFSPDGYFIATANQDGITRIYTMEKGFLDRQLSGHQAATTSLDFSPDGKYLLVGSADHTASIWDMWRNIKVGELKGHTKEVSGVTYSPKGDLIATCSYDGKMKLWKVSGETYTEVMEVKYGKKAKDRLRCVKFGPDGKKVALGSDDGVIRVFDIENQNVSLFLRGHEHSVMALDYSSDGKYLFSSSLDGSFRAWDTEIGEQVMKLGRAGAHKISSRHQGDQLLLADITGKVLQISTSKLDMNPPPLKSIFVASHDSKINYLKPKKIQIVLPKEKPIISLKQPIIPDTSHVVKTTMPTIRLKGSVISKSDIHHFSVNGFEIPIIADSAENFNYEVKLAYGDNTLKITAVDVYENVQTYVLKVQRYVQFRGITDHLDRGRKGSDYALIICTDDYEDRDWGNLENPINDGMSIKKHLEEIYGFNVEFLKNPTRTDIYLKLREYNKKVFADDDQLFIFIAGHGAYDEVFEEGYVVATNSKADDIIKETYVPYSNLKTMINNIPCDHTFLALDVCFGGTFDGNIARNDDKHKGLGDLNHWRSKNPYYSFYESNYYFDDRVAYIDRKMEKVSRLFMSSGGKEYVPDNDGSGHSPFCSKFLKALKSKGGEDGILTFSELYGMIEVTVPLPIKGKFGSNERTSDFLFIEKDYKK